jgi:hypothetical protein
MGHQEAGVYGMGGVFAGGICEMLGKWRVGRRNLHRKLTIIT